MEGNDVKLEETISDWRKNMIKNPYTPGAGTPPEYLAGREEVLKNAREAFVQLKLGGMASHTIYYGVRGVGKTVLLTEIEGIAKTEGCLYTQIECDEQFDFPKTIHIHCRQFIKQLSLIKVIADKLDKVKALLYSFKMTYSPTDSSVSLELSDEAQAMYGNADTGDMATDLISLFTELGELAKKAEKPICIFLDEIQAMNKDHLAAFIATIHRMNQLKLPILVFGAGLPTILRIAGDAKSYSERLFQFVEISNLKYADAEKALVEPAKKYAVNYEKHAIEYILQVTGCYPYFIQQYGQTIWKLANRGQKLTLEDAKTVYEEYIEKLNDSFYGVRFNRSTNAEKNFLFVMAKIGKYPCAMSDVAKAMGKKPRSISPLRNNLINKGLIYAPSFGEIDFTVPQFDLYLKRIEQQGKA